MNVRVAVLCCAVLCCAGQSKDPRNLSFHPSLPFHCIAAGAGDRRPLHRAAGGNHVEICRYLIEKGAKVDQPDKSGRTALHWAAISGHKEAAELLVARGGFASPRGCILKSEKRSTLTSHHT
jgi:hypothetical protein